MAKRKTPGGLYVARRAFKAHGRLYAVGEIISDPTEIKYFKARLSGGDILYLVPEEPELNKTWLAYLQARSGTPLSPELEEFVLGQRTKTTTASAAAKPSSAPTAPPAAQPAAAVKPLSKAAATTEPKK